MLKGLGMSYDNPFKREVPLRLMHLDKLMRQRPNRERDTTNLGWVHSRQEITKGGLKITSPNVVSASDKPTADLFR